MSNIFVMSYDEPAYDKSEIFRYAGMKEKSSETENLIDSALLELEGKISYKVCFGEFSVEFFEDFIDLGFAKTQSEKLKINLSGCYKTVVFAATLGIELDRMIARYSYSSPARAHILQAIGAERIEALCNSFCGELASEKALLGERICPRFSPGYGDLPLDMQKDIFRALDCPRRIGLSLCDSMMMSPSKSVTAIVGVSKSAL